MHAASVIRALRKRSSALPATAAADDDWSDEEAAPQAKPESPRAYSSVPTSPPNFQEVNAPGKGFDPAVSSFNDLVRESKTELSGGGITAGGVKYSSAEMEFYKQHLTGIKAKEPTADTPHKVGCKCTRCRDLRLDESTSGSLPRPVPMWMRGSSTAQAMATSQHQSTNRITSEELGRGGGSGSGDHESWSDDEDEAYYTEMKVSLSSDCFFYFNNSLFKCLWLCALSLLFLPVAEERKAGRNVKRCWRPHSGRPTPVSQRACFQRWRQWWQHQ